MKLIIAIVPDSESETISHRLTSSDFRVTLVASTGGFLRRGHSTLLVGVEDDQVEPALKIIRSNVPPPSEGDKHKATIFVLKIDQYYHF